MQKITITKGLFLFLLSFFYGQGLANLSSAACNAVAILPSAACE
jgi:hypothetical protein